MVKTAKDFEALNKAAFDDAMASAAGWSEDLGMIVMEIASYNQKAFETGSKVLEQAMAAPNAKETVDTNVEYARDAYEGYVDELKKIGELSLNAAQKACAPFEDKFVAEKKPSARKAS